MGTDVKEKGIQRVVVKPRLGSAGTGASKSGVSKSGAPKIDRQNKEKVVEMNRNNKAGGQHEFCAILGQQKCHGGAILGTPIGVTKIKHQTEIGTVEQNRAVKAEAQQKCGAISGALTGGPKI